MREWNLWAEEGDERVGQSDDRAGRMAPHASQSTFSFLRLVADPAVYRLTVRSLGPPDILFLT